MEPGRISGIGGSRAHSVSQGKASSASQTVGAGKSASIPPTSSQTEATKGEAKEAGKRSLSNLFGLLDFLKEMFSRMLGEETKTETPPEQVKPNTTEMKYIQGSLTDELKMNESQQQAANKFSSMSSTVRVDVVEAAFKQSEECKKIPDNEKKLFFSYINSSNFDGLTPKGYEGGIKFLAYKYQSTMPPLKLESFNTMVKAVVQYVEENPKGPVLQPPPKPLEPRFPSPKKTGPQSPASAVQRTQGGYGVEEPTFVHMSAVHRDKKKYQQQNLNTEMFSVAKVNVKMIGKPLIPGQASFIKFITQEFGTPGGEEKIKLLQDKAKERNVPIEVVMWENYNKVPHTTTDTITSLNFYTIWDRIVSSE